MVHFRFHACRREAKESQETNLDKTMEATISSKGQITLPQHGWERLHLTPGDKVLFLMEEDGSVHLIPKHASLKDLKGIVPKPEQPVSLEEMERAIGRGASD